MPKRLSKEDVIFVEGYIRNKMRAEGPLQWIPLAGDGSDRRIYRVRWDAGSLIAVSHPKGSGGEISENRSYLYLSRHLRGCGIEPPFIHDYRMRKGLFILEDLGDLTLQKLIGNLSLEEDILKTYRKVVEVLVRMQVVGKEGLDPKYCYQAPKYDLQVMLKSESGYFLRELLQGYFGLQIREGLIKREFILLAAQAAGEEPRYFLHRDFQSRNLMIKEKRLRVLDFQGARFGPLQYDIASLMIDPYVSLSEYLQQKIIKEYLAALSEWIPLDRERFFRYYPMIRLHRNLQILGAFAYLGSKKGRSYFISYIPRALASLRRTLGAHPEWECPYLRDTVERLFEETSGGRGPINFSALHQGEGK